MEKTFTVQRGHINPHGNLSAPWMGFFATESAGKIVPQPDRLGGLHRIELRFPAPVPMGQEVIVASKRPIDGDPVADVIITTAGGKTTTCSQARVEFASIRDKSRRVVAPSTTSVSQAQGWTQVMPSWSAKSGTFRANSTLHDQVRQIISLAGCCMERLPVIDQELRELHAARNTLKHSVEVRYVGVTIEIDFWDWCGVEGKGMHGWYRVEPVEASQIRTSTGHIFDVMVIEDYGDRRRIAARMKIRFLRLAEILGHTTRVNVFGTPPRERV